MGGGDHPRLTVGTFDQGPNLPRQRARGAAVVAHHGDVVAEVDEDIEVRIDAGGCWLQPPSIPHSLVDYSEDGEWVEVTAPAAFGTKEM